jgi:hypothetical protein
MRRGVAPPPAALGWQFLRASLPRTFHFRPCLRFERLLSVVWEGVALRALLARMIGAGDQTPQILR